MALKCLYNRLCPTQVLSQRCSHHRHRWWTFIMVSLPLLFTAEPVIHQQFVACLDGLMMHDKTSQVLILHCCCCRLNILTVGTNSLFVGRLKISIPTSRHLVSGRSATWEISGEKRDCFKDLDMLLMPYRLRCPIFPST